eukprot:1463987-Pyramimonas_sp.AAC.1
MAFSSASRRHPNAIVVEHTCASHSTSNSNSNTHHAHGDGDGGHEQHDAERQGGQHLQHFGRDLNSSVVEPRNVHPRA